MNFRGWHLLAAGLAGGLCGSMVGGPWPAVLVIGLVIGLVLGLFAAAFTIPLRPRGRPSRAPMWAVFILMVITAVSPFVIMTAFYAPPAWLLFRRIVYNPPPESVSDIRAAIEWQDKRQLYALRFGVSTGDVATITSEHEFKPVGPDAPVAPELAPYDALPDALEQPPAWFNPPGAGAGVERYATQHRQMRHVLIFDANTSQAWYLAYSVGAPPTPASD